MTRLKRRTIAIVFSVLAAGLASAGACSDEQERLGEPRRTVFSSREFDRGRTDGRRDAKAAWFDDSGAWMWLWMMDEDYAKGYEQGWTEGRSQAKFLATQEKKRRMYERQQEKLGSAGRKER
ncbi:MAG: hypothetical protein ACE5E1_03935 [Phycisphaerae bacterium]